jgi:hypothetical protein
MTTARAPRKTAQKTTDKPDFEVSTIEFRNAKFTFPKLQAYWPTRAIQCFQRGSATDRMDGIELLLGPEQWARFNEVAPLAGEFHAFYFGAFLPAANADVLGTGDDSDTDADSADKGSTEA